MGDDNRKDPDQEFFNAAIEQLRGFYYYGLTFGLILLVLALCVIAILRK